MIRTGLSCIVKTMVTEMERIRQRVVVALAMPLIRIHAAIFDLDGVAC